MIRSRNKVWVYKMVDGAPRWRRSLAGMQLNLGYWDGRYYWALIGLELERVHGGGKFLASCAKEAQDEAVRAAQRLIDEGRLVNRVGELDPASFDALVEFMQYTGDAASRQAALKMRAIGLGNPSPEIDWSK